MSRGEYRPLAAIQRLLDAPPRRLANMSVSRAFFYVPLPEQHPAQFQAACLLRIWEFQQAITLDRLVWLHQQGQDWLSAHRRPNRQQLTAQTIEQLKALRRRRVIDSYAENGQTYLLPLGPLPPAHEVYRELSGETPCTCGTLPLWNRVVEWQAPACARRVHDPLSDDLSVPCALVPDLAQDLAQRGAVGAQ